MNRLLILSTDPIDEVRLAQDAPRLPGNGAVVRFTGIVRHTEAAQPIAALEYEAFTRMAEHQLEGLADEIERRWSVASLRLVHRVGRVSAGEASLWMEVIAPHRGEAFAACQWLIDELKRVVPIWKKPIA